MASTIPRTRRKAIADAYVAKSLKIAFFTNLTGYDPLTATTYAALVSGGATEVSAAGTGYTTGGYALTGTAASNLSGVNGAIVTASVVTVGSATFSAQYGVIYDNATGNIEGIEDWGASYVVTNGTITVTFDSTNGIFNVQ
jgi:hypothetical protein